MTERRTGKIGVARGRFVADYFGAGWVNLSEPLLAERITPSEKDSVFERNGQPYRVDFAAMARAWGAHGVMVQSAAELGPALREALAR